MTKITIQDDVVTIEIKKEGLDESNPGITSTEWLKEQQAKTLVEKDSSELDSLRLTLGSEPAEQY